MSLSRRDVLKTAPVAAVPVIASTANAEIPPQPQPPAPPPPVAFPGMIVRMHEPRNWETPLIGDADANPWGARPLYIRNHFPVPAIDNDAYRLKVEGLVENPLELSLAELKKMGAVSRVLTLECAGNSRVYLTPPARGLQWGHGAVGFQTWEGVPLGAILERAKLKPGASEVILIGGDKGAVTSDPSSPGPINFDRGIPLTKAKKDETLIAWGTRNGPLTPDHGAPLRAVVGGWYGMAAVKWLTRIVVTDKPYDGFWQVFDYAYWDRKSGLPQLIPITEIQPKAIFTSLTDGAELTANTAIRLSGHAWAGESPVAKVEFSDDGGKTFTPTTLAWKPEEFRPVIWSHQWKVPAKKGPLKLVVRCTDTKGNTQAEKRDPDRRTYMINHLLPVEVYVR